MLAAQAYVNYTFNRTADWLNKKDFKDQTEMLKIVLCTDIQNRDDSGNGIIQSSFGNSTWYGKG